MSKKLVKLKMTSSYAWLVLMVFGILCGFNHHVTGQSRFRLAHIYSNQMVLQMAPKSTQIWGFGDPGLNVIVQLDSQPVIQTPVAADGKWSVRLPPQESGGPFTLQATQGPSEQVTIQVYFGDVWICSGQSNMEMPISDMLDPTGEILKSLTYNNLRLLRVGHSMSDNEQEELTVIETDWSSPTLLNIPGFSALCLMYGERISDSFNKTRPIGLIDTSHSNTRIEAWTNTETHVYCNTPPYTNSSDYNSDHVLWNSMVKPLTRTAVRGVIWFQGESNNKYNSEFYPCHLYRMVEDWRTAFLDGNVAVPQENNLAFPFGVVQIGPFSGGGPSNFGYLRWHQTIDIGVLPNVFIPEGFMAATYDLTDPNSPTGNFHPRDKMTVADRLANAAKSFLYGADFKMNGPSPVLATVTEPGMITIEYDMGVIVTSINGFTARLNDGTWVDAFITGSATRKVFVTFDSSATHLAYAWQGVVCDYKLCSIYSEDLDHLPANVWLWQLQ